MPLPAPLDPKDPGFMRQQRRLAIWSFAVSTVVLLALAGLSHIIDAMRPGVRVGATATFVAAVLAVIAGAVLTYAGARIARWAHPAIALGLGTAAGGIIGMAFVARPPTMF